MAFSRPLSFRVMRVRCAQGHASETYRWYRSASAKNPLEPSAVTWFRNLDGVRTNSPFLLISVDQSGGLTLIVYSLQCKALHTWLVQDIVFNSMSNPWLNFVFENSLNHDRMRIVSRFWGLWLVEFLPRFAARAGVTQCSLPATFF